MRAQAQQPTPNITIPGMIQGVLLDANGAPFPGARIALTPSASPSSAQTVTSDSSGHFSFTSVPPGPFVLAIASDGFAPRTVAGILHADETEQVPAIVLHVTARTDIHVTASQQDIATEQFHYEEKQRVLGVIPNFYVSYAPNAPALTTRQKFGLAWKTSIDPITFLSAGAFAGVEQATNTLSGYGQGVQGYAKRYGANYADMFVGTMIGSAILPALLKQDPRYFYKGTGTTRSRILYAIATSVICKGDNGRWQPNYSGIAGSLAAGGISNLYYPASDRNGASLIFESALIGTAGSAVQNLFQEFVVRRLTPGVPHYAPPALPR